MIMLRALAATWLTDRPHAGVREPYERLLDVRDALHLSSGRTLDRLLASEVDDVAARWDTTDARRPASGRQHGGAPDRARGRPDRPRGPAGRPAAPGAQLRPAGAPARVQPGRRTA